jgi:hypothetical protein
MKCGRHKPQVPSSRAQCRRATAVRANGIQDPVVCGTSSLINSNPANPVNHKINFHGLDYTMMNAIQFPPPNPGFDGRGPVVPHATAQAARP